MKQFCNLSQTHHNILIPHTQIKSAKPNQRDQNHSFFNFQGNFNFSSTGEPNVIYVYFVSLQYFFCDCFFLEVVVRIRTTNVVYCSYVLASRFCGKHKKT